jgi:ribonuclease BN (tRNA processing enzyme)
LKVIFLGTNGWYDTDTGNTICTLIKTLEADIILDAGNGFYKINRYIPRDDQKPVYLLLSHFHLDHIIGLHILNKFEFARGLTICGPEGTRNILGTIINHPYTAPLAQLPFAVRICELPSEHTALPFKVTAKPLFHVSYTLGYRIEIDGKVISYCPDTGYCENAVELSRSADLVIAECAYKSGQSCEDWPHLNPETAAGIARDAGATQLALVHFDADIYQTLEERKGAERAAQEIFQNTLAAKDGMEIELEG